MVAIPVRAKYRQQNTVKQNKARVRTGPRCCTDGCPKTKPVKTYRSKRAGRR